MRVQIIGAERFRERIPHILANAPAAIMRGLVTTGKFVVGEVSRELIRGRPYPRSTSPTGLGYSFVVRPSANAVHVGSPLVYAPVHEYGATIRRKTAKVLAWVTSGRRPEDAAGWKAARAAGRARYALQVTIPARPYFYPALERVAKRDMPEIMKKELDKVFGGH